MTKRLFLILTVLLSTNLFSQKPDPYRLDHKVEPVYQFIHLDLDPDMDFYKGHTSIELEVREEVTSFRLHAKDINITAMEFKKGNDTLSVKYEFQPYGLFKVIPKNEILPGKYFLKFDFNGQYDFKGQGIVKYTKDSLNYLFTHMEPIHARRFFPCFDEPSFKFIYQLEISTLKDHLVVSNTPVEKESIEDEIKTIVFKKTNPTPSYLLAFAVGPYETVSIPGLSVPGRIILSKGYSQHSHYIKENTAKILRALKDYFDMPYPYEKLDFIGVVGEGGAMENPGLVVFEDIFLIDNDQMSLNEKYYRARVTAHELAHMWFGNLVSLKWWDDNWLKEGFAEWLAKEVMLQNYSHLSPMEKIAESMNRPLDDDTKSTTEPIHRHLLGSDNPSEVFGALTYSKSPAVLRMVENWIGKDTFQKAMKIYFEKYRWKNADASDLFEILDDVSAKDVTRVMTDFVFQAGVPIITVFPKNSNTLLLSQQRYKSLENEESYPFLWHIPVALKIHDGSSLIEKYVYINEQKKTFTFSEIDTIKWVHLKNNLRGYYLQILPKDMFEQAIHSDDLSQYEKNDLFTAVRYHYLAGDINPTELLHLGYTLRKSSDFAMIESVSDRITDINNDFTEVINWEDFNLYLDSTCVPLLDEIGYEFDNDEPGKKSNTRSYLFGLLRHNVEVRSRVLEMAKQYLLDGVPISFSNFMYFVLLFYYEGDEAIYEEVLQRLEDPEKSNERYALSYILGWFQNDRLIRRNLDYALNGTIGPFERLNIVLSIHDMYRFERNSKETILPWFHEHYTEFQEQIQQEYLDLYYMTSFISTNDDLDLFNQLFPEKDRSKILNKKISVKIEELKRRQALQKLYSTDINVYLHKFRKNH